MNKLTPSEDCMKLYKNYLMDMDGVLVRGRTVVDGAQRFIDALNARGLAYLVLDQ